MIRPEDQRLLQPYLLPGERLLWSGGPPRGLRLRSADLLLIPFSLLWGGFAILWNVMVWVAEGSWFPRLWGLPFLVVGLYLIVGRFLHDALLRASLVYAVTNRRVIVLRTRLGRGLRSAELGYLPLLELDEHFDGRGTLRFDVEPDDSLFFRHNEWGRWIPSSDNALRFDRIERPRIVYDLIRRETDRRRVELFGEAPAARAFIG